MVQALKMYIDGKWVESESGRTFDATNPATGEVIATLPEGTRLDAQRAIDAARASKHKIAKMSTWERAKLCQRVGDIIESRREAIARVISQDQGKPYHTEALAEVSFAAHGWHMAGEQIKYLETSVIPVEDRKKRVFSFRQPRGVYAVVTPWNFPFNIPTEYLSPGLATGNAIVWVPAPTTSVCAVELMKCIEDADVPPGVVNLVTGMGPVVGDEIVANAGTDAVGFTGSPVTGKTIAGRAAGKPLLLELGGNGPTLVFDDADMDLVTAALKVGCFFNAGQVCSATERILVHRKVHDDLIDRLVNAAQSIKLGDPLDPATTMGPLNNAPVALKMDRHLEDGVARGGKIVYGGSRAPELGSELFYRPTIIDNVAPDSLLNHEETFGPIAPVMMFSDDDEALEYATNTTLGLVSAVFTTNIKRAFYFAENVRTGIVNVNEHSNYWEAHIPFGGVAGTQSGIGRLGGKHTMMEMTDLRTVCIDVGF